MGATKKIEPNKHGRSGVSRSTPRHIPNLDDIRKAPNGNAAVEALVSAGVEPEKLEWAMQLVVLVHLMPPAARLQDVRGFTRKSLPMFPNELRRTARRIEIVRKNPMYAAVLNLCVPSSKWEQTCSDLKTYADWLDIVIRSMRQNAEDNPREYDLRLFSKRRLLAEVAEATGDPYCGQVAELLNAAYDLADPEGPIRTEDASALGHLWKTHVKKNAQRRSRRWAWMMAD